MIFDLLHIRSRRRGVRSLTGAAALLGCSAGLWAQTATPKAATAGAPATPSTAPAPAPDPTGHWEGAIKAQMGAEIVIAVDLTKTKAGALAGTIDTPGQALKGIPLANVSIDGSAVKFEIGAGRGFTGKLAADGQTMEGSYTQAGLQGPFHLKRMGAARMGTATASAAVSPELVGTWEGTMERSGMKFNVILGLSNTADETAEGNFEFAGMGLRIPVAGIVQRGAQVTFQIPAFGGSYAGALSGEAGELVGTLTRDLEATPLTLKRTAARAK